ncbi:unnamed protein product [Prorocentrum cordatum]|uniref:Uncharacterized protein n=1 Tax=Prorocentrum cordatum TaxID=2364126 RepID=A0ABN9V7A6_9DINO|nr:unnamed protein product [Polarella glacialis]
MNLALRLGAAATLWLERGSYHCAKGRLHRQDYDGYQAFAFSSADGQVLQGLSSQQRSAALQEALSGGQEAGVGGRARQQLGATLARAAVAAVARGQPPRRFKPKTAALASGAIDTRPCGLVEFVSECTCLGAAGDTQTQPLWMCARPGPPFGPELRIHVPGFDMAAGVHAAAGQDPGGGVLQVLEPAHGSWPAAAAAAFGRLGRRPCNLALETAAHLLMHCPALATDLLIADLILGEPPARGGAAGSGGGSLVPAPLYMGIVFVHSHKVGRAAAATFPRYRQADGTGGWPNRRSGEWQNHTLFGGEKASNPRMKRGVAVRFNRPASSSATPHQRPIFVVGPDATDDPRMCVDFSNPGRFSSGERTRWDRAMQAPRPPAGAPSAPAPGRRPHSAELSGGQIAGLQQRRPLQNPGVAVGPSSRPSSVSSYRRGRHPPPD